MFKILGKKKLEWIHVEYPCSEQTISDKLINKMVNRLWTEKFKDLESENKYLILMFRVTLDNGDIKTLTKLQKLRLESKEFLKKFLQLKALLIQDAYSDAPIKSVIFSYGIREFKYLKNEFIDSVLEEMKPIESKALIHNYKNYKLPIATDLNKYGKFITEGDNFKNIDLGRNKLLNVIITEKEGYTHYKFQLIKNNKVRVSWEDQIISLEEDHLIRTVGKTIIDFYAGKFFYSRTIIPQAKIQKIKNKKGKIEDIINEIIAADTETILNPDKTMIPYLLSFKSTKELTNIFNKDQKELFNNFINKLLIRKYRGYNIYFHNLSGFDAFFLIKHLIYAGFDLDPKIHSGKLINLRVSKGRNYYEIKDSNLLLLQSLSKLSKSFKLEVNKGIFPYLLSDINYSGEFPDYTNFAKVSLEDYNKEKSKFKNINWNFKKEAIKYCQQDSIILFKVLQAFAILIWSKFNLSINDYPTIPSLAFAIFRKNFMSKESIAILKGKIQKAIQLGYTGGSTDMFIPQFNVLNNTEKKLYAYDINSLYPFVMANNDFPIGDPSYIEIGENKNLEAHLSLFGHFFAKVTAPDNLLHPILQLHYNNRTISPLGTFSGWFFSEELKNALAFGYKIEIFYGYSFDKGNIFKEYVETLYQIRTSYPKSDPMNYIAKILLNSLYGRFGMHDLSSGTDILEKEEFLKWTEDEKIDILETIEFGKYIMVRYKSLTSLKEKLNESKDFSNVNIAIASAVTAYARIHMSKFKNNQNLPNLYYTDTDSLYFDGPLPDSYISNTKLGKLKLEGVWDKAIFLAPKVYALTNNEETVIKVKGLSKDAINRNNVTFDLLTTLLTEDYKLTFNQTKWFKSLSNANIKVVDQIYTLRATGNKRTLIYSEGKLTRTESLLLF